MRVLQVYRDYFTDLPGGIERHVRDLAHGLRHLGEIEVLSSARSRRATTRDDAGVKVHLAGELARFQGVPVSPGYRRVIAKGDYDLVHVHCPNPTGEVAFLTSGFKGAAVATFHAVSDRAKPVPGYDAFLARLFDRCSRVIASSEQLVDGAKVLARLRDRHPHKLAVVPFGVDTTRFTPGPTDASRRLRDDWPTDQVVLFVGRLRYYKGLPVLIEALRNLDTTLVVVGDGNERERVVNTASSALGDRFVHIPHASEDELPEVYRASDVFCLPSTSPAEAFGLATLEAMSSGLPVITTELGTATSVVNQHGETGLVVPPKDHDALRGALEKVLSDPDLAQQMRAAARRRAVERYDKGMMLGRVGAIYEEVVQEGGRT